MEGGALAQLPCLPGQMDAVQLAGLRSILEAIQTSAEAVAEAPSSQATAHSLAGRPASPPHPEAAAALAIQARYRGHRSRSRRQM